jgi:hypothetical protein
MLLTLSWSFDAFSSSAAYSNGQSMVEVKVFFVISSIVVHNVVQRKTKDVGSGVPTCWLFEFNFALFDNALMNIKRGNNMKVM